MNPWIQAALILAAFLAIGALLLGWMNMWVKLTDKWPEWACFTGAISPLLIALYATILHTLTQ